MESSSFWSTSNIIGIPGLVLAAIAIPVSLWIYFKQKNKKRLEYKVIANERLLSYHKDLEKELEITFKGERINNLLLLNLKFINSGNCSN